MSSTPHALSVFCPRMRFYGLWLAGICTFSCIGFGRRDKSSEQVASERALLNKKTALLERENQVLRDENLELTRAMELQKADFDKKQASLQAEQEKRATQLKTTETNLANLTEKLAILESESGGKIKQLNQLNEQLAQKSAETQRKLQEDLAALQLSAAKEKEQLSREAAEKQFGLGKEIQELRQRLGEKEKEIAELRETQIRLQREIAELKKK
jgi:hypothetical protein